MRCGVAARGFARRAAPIEGRIAVRRGDGRLNVASTVPAWLNRRARPVWRRCGGPRSRRSARHRVRQVQAFVKKQCVDACCGTRALAVTYAQCVSNGNRLVERRCRARDGGSFAEMVVSATIIGMRCDAMRCDAIRERCRRTHGNRLRRHFSRPRDMQSVQSGSFARGDAAHALMPARSTTRTVGGAAVRVQASARRASGKSQRRGGVRRRPRSCLACGYKPGAHRIIIRRMARSRATAGKSDTSAPTQAVRPVNFAGVSRSFNHSKQCVH